MNITIKKKIVAALAVLALAFQFALLSCSPVYSCLTQNPKQLYYAICYHLEHDSDKSFCGKINSVIAGFQGYANLKPLSSAVNLENEVKYCWIDIWGYIQKKMGIVYFPGQDADVVLLPSGHLALMGGSPSYMDGVPSEISADLYCKTYNNIYQYFEKQDIDVFYILFPRIIHQRTEKNAMPFNIKDNVNRINTERINKIIENHIPAIDARDLYKDAPDVHYKLFYKGDHHWMPEYAYRVYLYIAQELETQHSPMAKYFSRENMAWDDYSIEKRIPPFYRHVGSTEQRVGRCFLPERDITPYMIPRGETNYTFQVPSLDINKTGSIDDTFLEFFDNESIEIITNNRAKNKNKIIVFHNSFIHSFAPFLAANNHCLYMIDMRGFHGNVVDLIEREKPDAIFFAYNYAPYSHIKTIEEQIQDKQKRDNSAKND